MVQIVCIAVQDRPVEVVGESVQELGNVEFGGDLIELSSGQLRVQMGQIRVEIASSGKKTRRVHEAASSLVKARESLLDE
jgi:hypothetical protein